ncbi:MAG: glycerol-3-phosphate 1-O-acyltransferase PlsY [Gammaproteobacteria bacterium]|nr:glycerol-3-phosphate 1-O-acyltransferase PlsY [Gammaproteobacteria bacterium]
MNFELHYLVYALAGYLVGSVSSAIITCKLMGLKDPRSVGSHNPGATNVLRHCGKKAAIITLIGDMIKGWLPVTAVTLIEPAAAAIAVTGLGAFLGHIYPIYYGLKGGKGVATYFGVLVGFNWITGVAALLIWLLAALVTKISSLSALISAMLAPLILWQISQSPQLSLTLALMSIVMFWRHRSNIQNIIHGTEHKIGVKKHPE